MLILDEEDEKQKTFSVYQKHQVICLDNIYRDRLIDIYTDG